MGQGEQRLSKLPEHGLSGTAEVPGTLTVSLPTGRSLGSPWANAMPSRFGDFQQEAESWRVAGAHPSLHTVSGPSEKAPCCDLGAPPVLVGGSPNCFLVAVNPASCPAPGFSRLSSWPLRFFSLPAGLGPRPSPASQHGVGTTSAAQRGPVPEDSTAQGLQRRIQGQSFCARAHVHLWAPAPGHPQEVGDTRVKVTLFLTWGLG